MKRFKRLRSRTVQAKDPAEFDDLFNEVADEMGSDAELKWDGEMCVHFIYSETVEVPENAKDVCNLKGKTYRCGECPLLKIVDGKCTCKRSRGNFDEYEPACNWLYEQVVKGVFDL